MSNINLLTSFQNELEVLFNNNIIFLILLNVFFIIASYTDIKSMKIYDKFNIVMLITRIVLYIYLYDYQKPYTENYIQGGLFLFFIFLIAAIITVAKIAGDIKFAGNLGLWLGITPSFALVGLTLLLNLLFRIFVKDNKKKKIALAPFFYVAFLIMTTYYYFFM